jgi:TrmH family RNA methyltransferase
VQRLRRLVSRRAARTEAQAFVVEGARLLRTALDARAEVESVYLDGARPPDPVLHALVDRAHDRGARVFELAPGVLEKVGATVTPQPVVAVVRMPTGGADALRGASFVVVCAGVRDPGNAGTVLRSADAAGADVVAWCDTTVDPFNPKAVRASAGSVFHVPIVTEVPTGTLLGQLGAAGLQRWGAVAHGGRQPSTVDFTAPVALVFGNESWGLSAGVEAELDGLVTIPLAGRAESLNVSMAATVLCFEVLRQRSILPPSGGGG